VPGTLGGAVAMNAGTRSGELGDVLVSVRVMGPDGTIQDLDHARLGFAYRTANVPAGSLVVSARLRATVGGVDEGKARVREEREYRNRTQPYSSPSAGSVFRNPEGDHAGRLIEAAQLKGTRRGGAQISPLHANFIVTEEGATAADVLELMALARREVRTQFGVQLHPEQRLLGFSEHSVLNLLDQLEERLQGGRA
ncbi:MAG: UDP-N-acetylmuramate dehydrogenase, partial [Myxococcales bacterium]|nr:UDP-N-acetylmuramate dehydrogenase [Myxococcales bacterium]